MGLIDSKRLLLIAGLTSIVPARSATRISVRESLAYA
jgi:hypothetical protein